MHGILKLYGDFADLDHVVLLTGTGACTLWQSGDSVLNFMEVAVASEA